MSDTKMARGDPLVYHFNYKVYLKTKALRPNGLFTKKKDKMYSYRNHNERLLFQPRQYHVQDYDGHQGG